MKIKNKKMLLAAAIVLLLAAAAGIIIFDRDSSVDFEKNLELAEAYLESSDYDNAIAIYNGLIAKDDSCSEAYAGLAEAYYTKGNTEKALKILEKGLEYSADEDIVIEKIKAFFPDYDLEAFGYEDDEYFAEVPEETEVDTETEAAYISEEAVTETTAVPETEEMTETTTAEITTTVTTTTVQTTTTAPVTTTTVPITTTAAPVTTTAAPRTTTTAAATTTTTAAKEPEAVVVDDLTMMTISEAEAWCESNNLTLSVIGGGYEIISQSPAPGSIIEEYSEIIVRCE